MSFLSSSDDMQTDFDNVIEAHQCQPCGQPTPTRGVGALLLRRIRYVARWVYWSVRHRSTANAAWICAYEGHQWS